MNFWTELEKQTSKSDLEKYLLNQLGKPSNQLQQNLYGEILKKIASYYLSQETNPKTVYSLIGIVSKITEKLRKTGKHQGQTKYLVEVKEPNQNSVIFQAYQENLPEAKWSQVAELAILHQNLAFKYKKWLTNYEVLDFYSAPPVNPPEPTSQDIKAKSLKRSTKTLNGTDVG